MHRSWIAVVVLSVLLALGALYAKAQRELISELRTERSSLIQERDAAKAKLATAQRQATLSNTDAQRARLELQHVLDQLPESRATVPEPIVDSLCRTLRCVKPGGVRTPGS